jgi:cytochrome P450
MSVLKNKSFDPHYLINFGSGMRKCPGKDFAMIFMERFF